MDAANTQELTSYRANCHCGDVTFTVTLPSLTDHEVMSCNCSICVRNGYLFVYPELKNILFHSGYDHLKSYSFGAKRIAHKFCPICGSSIIETDHSGGKLFMGVNVRMFENIDIKGLKLKYGNWKAKGVQYVVPKIPDVTSAYSTSMPSELTPYFANCQCGAVTYTFYITSLAQCEVIDCNCSICTRNGYLLVYPKRKHVIFHSGYDDLHSYNFGEKLLTHKFCATCGSSIVIDFHGQPCIRGDGDRLGINVRMVQDMELMEMNFEHVDGKRVMPEYTGGNSKE